MTDTLPEDIRRKYETHAARFSRDYEERPYWQGAALRRISDYLDQNPTELVLDIGCGSGFLIRTLALRHPQVRFIGVDFSGELIRIAENSSPPPNVKFMNEDVVLWKKGWVDLRPASGKNVLCLVVGVMEHYGPGDDFTRAAQEIWSGIEKGALFITFHNASMFGRALLKRRSKKYWDLPQAIEGFRGNRDGFQVVYRSFALCDLLARGPFPAAFLLAVDRKVSSLPLFFSRKFATLLELTLRRPGI